MRWDDILSFRFTLSARITMYTLLTTLGTRDLLGRPAMHYREENIENSFFIFKFNELLENCSIVTGEVFKG